MDDLIDLVVRAERNRILPVCEGQVDASGCGKCGQSWGVHNGDGSCVDDSAPVPQFAVGDRVKAIAFVDCFDRYIVERPNMTVTDVRFVDGYYRVTAHGSGVVSMVEGAERFFQKM